MQITNSQFENRMTLLEAIKTRQEPLGVGLKNACFVGVAIEMAKECDSNLLDHFGGSSSEWKTAVRINNECEVHTRNAFMSDYLVENMLH